ncbi:hypothetical protein K8R33_00970 [archaeon]|nr:hypothetical protein [archaeon]
MRILIVPILLILFSFSVSATSSLDSLTLNSNYESIGVRVDYSGDPLESIQLEFKESSSSIWKQGHDLYVHDSNSAYGSVFYLEENTDYDVRVSVDGSYLISQVKTLNSDINYGGNDYYVSVNGDDTNSGLNVGDSFRTIQRASNVAQAGDVVHVYPGIYYETVDFSVSGSDNNYIVFKAEDDVFVRGSIESFETIGGTDDWIYDSGSDSYRAYIGFRTYHVAFDEDTRLFNYNQQYYSQHYTFDEFSNGVLESDGVFGGYYSNDNGWLYVKLPDGSDPDSHEMHVAGRYNGFNLNGVSNIILDGFNLGFFGRSSGDEAILIEDSNNIIIQNNILHNTRYGVSVVGEAYNNLIQNNEFYDTSIFEWAWERNKAHDTEGCAVSLKGRGGNSVRDNEIHGNMNGVCASIWGDLNNINLNYNVEVYRNIFYDIKDDGVEPEGATVNFRIISNEFRTTHNPLSFVPINVGPVYAIRNQIFAPTTEKYTGNFYKVGGYAGRVYLYHNTAVRFDGNNGFGPTEIFGSGNFGNLVLRNNIGYSDRYVFESYSGYDPVNNDWDYNCLFTTRSYSWIKWGGNNYLTPSEFYSATGNEEHGIKLNPLFENVGSFDIQLDSGSPCVDSGVLIPNINDYSVGDGPDMGALEFGESFCGDLVVDVDEECDGFNLDGKTCLDYGYISGDLDCVDCEFDFSDCNSRMGKIKIRPVRLAPFINPFYLFLDILNLF